MTEALADLQEAWWRMWQVRTPAEAALNLWVDWWLTWHQALRGAR